ncbi:MAG: hypothetical protein AAF975_07320 [Spirochaetota bacterium]
MKNKIWDSPSLLIFAFFGLPLLLSGCLSLKMVLNLHEGGGGTVELEYQLEETLLNISNYPAPHDDIAPLPLPLWEWDFRAIAAQSSGLELLDYSFKPQGKQGKGVVRATLRFANEDDLRLLLGPELRWQGGAFQWQLSAVDAEAPDVSYPALDADLSKEEQQMLERFFAGQTLEITMNYGKKQKTQRLAMPDFLSGKEHINLTIVR